MAVQAGRRNSGGNGRRPARGAKQAPPERLRHSYTVPPPEGSLGELIRKERVARNWTQEYLAELIDVKQPQVSAYERGEIQMPDPAVLVRLAEAFGIDKALLLDLTPWQGSTRRLESVPPSGALVVPETIDRPQLLQTLQACVALTDEELAALDETIEFIIKARPAVDGAADTDQEQPRRREACA